MSAGHYIEKNQTVGARPGGRPVECGHFRVNKLAGDLGIRNLPSWTKNERDGFARIAPIVAAADPAAWPAEAGGSLRTLLRAKGSPFEADYMRRLCHH